MNLWSFIKMKYYVFDNGGETLDRYTVIDKHGDMLSLSETGAGVSMFCGNAKLDGMYQTWTIPKYIRRGLFEHFGKQISFKSLPIELQQHIISRYEQH